MRLLPKRDGSGLRMVGSSYDAPNVGDRVAMSFFAGSVFNEAIGDMSKSVWAIAGAVAFVATGYFGLRYARKRSEKEKDGLYKD